MTLLLAQMISCGDGEVWLPLYILWTTDQDEDCIAEAAQESSTAV